MRTINLRLKKKLDEIYVIEPNNLGARFLNDIYKRINIYFKTAPFIVIVPLSFIIAILIYLVFGFLLVRLVSILQYGF